jgi:hypothetical protein
MFEKLCAIRGNTITQFLPFVHNFKKTMNFFLYIFHNLKGKVIIIFLTIDTH